MCDNRSRDPSAGRKMEQREEILETSSLIHVETVGHRAGQAEPGRQEPKQSEATKKIKVVHTGH